MQARPPVASIQGALGPTLEWLESADALFPVVRYAVLNPWRDLRMDGATDKPLVLQIAQCCGQYLMGNLGH